MDIQQPSGYRPPIKDKYGWHNKGNTIKGAVKGTGQRAGLAPNSAKTPQINSSKQVVSADPVKPVAAISHMGSQSLSSSQFANTSSVSNYSG